jgi:UDP-glucose-4-epimerase GalE
MKLSFFNRRLKLQNQQPPVTRRFDLNNAKIELRMNVLVTGGAGYIGSHAAKHLANANIQPIVVDNLKRGHKESVQWGPLIEADVGDRAALEGVFEQYSIEAVLHFAAVAYVGESMKDPALYFRNNVVNTLNLLDTMRARGVRTIVFSSTCATYGDPRQIPIAEDHIQAPVNPYGESKLMVERLLHWYGAVYGLRWAALRYFNAAGADPDGQVGENHEPETHLVPLAISAAARFIDAIEVFGTDYETPDGTAIRDYLHVTDLAEAHLAALRYLDGGGPSAAFNLGTGRGHSVREVIAMVERVTGQNVAVREVSRRLGDPPCLVADATKAGKLMGWRPQHSALEDIVRTAWNWRMKQKPTATAR